MQTHRQHLPLVRLSLIQPFVTELDRRGVAVEPVLQAFDLSVEMVANPEVFVPARTVYLLTERFAAAAEDPYLGLRMGERLNISAWAPFAEAAATARTTAELLLYCSINASRDASSASLSLQTTGEQTSFHVRRVVDDKFKPAQVDAFWIGILITLLKRASGKNWEPTATLATVCDPAALPADYEGIRVATGGLDGPCVSFPSSWLLLPYVPDSAGQPSVSPADSLPAQSFVDSVRQILEAHVADPNLNASLAANLCGMSKRTLQLRLQNCGATVSGVIGELRRNQAIEDLTQTDRRIADIAARVGYADPAVFSRSFKRWTGSSPQAFRKR